MTLFDDDQLRRWLMGIHHGEPAPSGSFLKKISEAALAADDQNFAILYSALKTLSEKYPKYHCSCWEEGA